MSNKPIKTGSSGSGTLKMGVFTLAMINVSAIVSLRGLPAESTYGLSSAFYYIFAAVFFLIPVSLVAAELTTGWPQKGGVFRWVGEAFGTRLGFLAISLAFVILIGAASWLALSPHEESRRDMWQYIYVVVGVALNLLFAISLLFLRYVENSITSPLEHLSKIVSQFANRDHRQTEKNEQFIEKFEPPRTGDEIQALSTSFKQMMIDITGYVENLEIMTREKERIGAELHVATQIQADMLPRIFPPFPERREFDIYASMNPAKEVGGDFYDFFLVDNRHFAVVIADVSGKGVPAALFMVIAKTLIKSHAQFGNEPADIFTITNNQLCEGNEAGLFVTAWMGILDLHTGDLSCVNAGHNPPLVALEGEEFTYLKQKSGFILAGFEGFTYETSAFQMKKGDRIFLYTDGVTEAMNPQDELFGDQRLLAWMNEHRHEELEDVLHGLRKEISVFADGADQNDDITMLMFELV